MTRDLSHPDPARTWTAFAIVGMMFLTALALYWAQVILIPVAMAIFLTFVLTPLVTFLERRRLGRVPSVVIVLLFTLTMFAAVTVVVGAQMAQLAQTLPDYADQIRGKIDTVKGWLASDDRSRFSLLVNELSDSLFGPADTTAVVSASPSWVAQAQTYLSPAAEFLGQAALTFILVVFMLLRREDLRNRMIRLIGQGRVTTTTKAVDEASQRISRFLLAQFILNAAFGLVVTGGLILMGVRYAPLWGFVAFLMRYVPYIGTWIGLLPPVLFTFATADGWLLPVGVLALFLGLEVLCNNLFEPVLYGKRLGLSEVAQLVATAFWAFLWGPVGMVLAWPLTTCLLVLGKYVPQTHFLSILLGDEPVLTPRVAFYQRLTARDQDEAATIAEKQLETLPVEQVFDDLLVAALSEARLDVAENRLTPADLTGITTAVQEVAEEVTEDREPAPVEPEDRARVLIVPARDTIDHAGAFLLSRLLDQGLWEADVIPVNTLTSELLVEIDKHQPSAVVIATVPPGGVTHTRYLCKRIRRQFPDVKIVVGLWAGPDVDTGAINLLRQSGADEVGVSLESTRSVLSGWQAVFVAGAVGRTETEQTPVSVA